MVKHAKIEEGEEGGRILTILWMKEKVKGGEVINPYLSIAQALSSFPLILAMLKHKGAIVTYPHLISTFPQLKFFSPPKGPMVSF